MFRKQLEKIIKEAREAVEGSSPGEDYTNKMFVFDVDETLFETKAKIVVLDKKTGEVRHELTNTEFNSYNLKPDEEYSFAQFTDMELFRNTSTPITRMLDLLRDLKDEGQVVLMTARVLPSGRNALDGFFNAFADYYGTRRVMQNVPIFMVGGSENKKAAFQRLIKNYKPDYIEFYDDHLQNLEDLKELDVEGVTIRTFLLNHGQEREV